MRVWAVAVLLTAAEARNRMEHGASCRILHSLRPSPKRFGEPQWTPPPFTVIVTDPLGHPAIFYTPRTEYTVEIEAAEALRGFLIQPRLATREGFIIGHLKGGYFVRESGWRAGGIKYTDCPPNFNDSVTNRDFAPRRVLRLKWRTDRFVGPVQFYFTLFKTETEYWPRWEPVSGFILPRPKFRAIGQLKIPPALLHRLSETTTEPTSTTSVTSPSTSTATTTTSTPPTTSTTTTTPAPTTTRTTSTTTVEETTPVPKATAKKTTTPVTTTSDIPTTPLRLIHRPSTSPFTTPEPLKMEEMEVRLNQPGSPSITFEWTSQPQSAPSSTTQPRTNILTTAFPVHRYKETGESGENEAVVVDEELEGSTELWDLFRPTDRSFFHYLNSSDPGPCDPTPCRHGGLCNALPTSSQGHHSQDEDDTVLSDHFFCVCPPQFIGERCERENGCFGRHCGHGTCQMAPTGNYTCLCDPEWAGPECQWDCPSYLCKNGGTCTIDRWGSYGCLCPPGYAGDDCESESDECASGPCLNGGTCTDGFNSYRCACAPGWNGRNCHRACQDVYSTCDLWQRQEHCLTAAHTDFFSLNCAKSCGVCQFANHSVRTDVPIPPALEELWEFVGVWEGRGSRGLRFPVDFLTPVGYSETLSFLVTQPPMFGAPYLNYTSVVRSDDGEDVKVTMGFLTIRTRPPIPKKVALMTTSNEGVTVVEEGAFDENMMSLKAQHFISVPFGAQLYDTKSVRREYRLDGDIMREILSKVDAGGNRLESVKYFYRTHRFHVF